MSEPQEHTETEVAVMMAAFGSFLLVEVPVMAAIWVAFMAGAGLFSHPPVGVAFAYVGAGFLAIGEFSAQLRQKSFEACLKWTLRQLR